VIGSLATPDAPAVAAGRRSRPAKPIAGCRPAVMRRLEGGTGKADFTATAPGRHVSSGAGAAGAHQRPDVRACLGSMKTFSHCRGAWNEYGREHRSGHPDPPVSAELAQMGCFDGPTWCWWPRGFQLRLRERRRRQPWLQTRPAPDRSQLRPETDSRRSPCWTTANPLRA